MFGRNNMEVKNFIIGFSGKAYAGKDTYADELKKQILEDLGEVVHTARFADGVKEFVSIMTGVGANNFNHKEFKERFNKQYQCTYRELLIAVGEGFRALDPLYWVKKTMGSITKPGVYVIPDVRSHSEVDAIHDAGGIVIRIEPKYESYVPMEYANTPLETMLDDYEGFDMIIGNRSMDLLEGNTSELLYRNITKIKEVLQ